MPPSCARLVLSLAALGCLTAGPSMVRGQLLPSLSSTEAELYGLSTGVCDLLACVQTLEEMLVVFTAPVTVLTDSRGARLISDDHAASARTRHVHRRWHFVRFYRDDGRLRVLHVKGSLNHANFLTKAVGGAAFAADRAYTLGDLATCAPAPAASTASST